MSKSHKNQHKTEAARVVDNIALWLANAFADNKETAHKARQVAIDELAKLYADVDNLKKRVERIEGRPCHRA